MTVTIVKAPTMLQFTLWGEPCQRIFDWASTLDELVFREQLATGSFHGRWEIGEPERQIMQLIEAQGQIAPYYGMGGSRGVCVYAFRPTLPTCRVRVDHTVTEQWPEANLPVEPLAEGEEPDVRARFTIAGTEYTTLQQWDNWVDAQALSSRYTFLFGIVSMGSGYTVKVRDHRSDILLDATDYQAW